MATGFSVPKTLKIESKEKVSATPENAKAKLELLLTFCIVQLPWFHQWMLSFALARTRLLIKIRVSKPPDLLVNLLLRYPNTFV